MLRLFRSKKAQTTAEYAILIGLVVAALIAMQTYVKRGLQGRMRDASDSLTAGTSGIGSTNQYEPYYLEQDTTTSTTGSENENTAVGGAITRSQNTTTGRTGTQTFR